MRGDKLKAEELLREDSEDDGVLKRMVYRH